MCLAALTSAESFPSTAVVRPTGHWGNPASALHHGPVLVYPVQGRTALTPGQAMPKSAFFAYPAQPQFVGDTIVDSIPKARTNHDLIISPWSKLNIIGLKLDTLIREKIAGSDFLLAEVTYPNFNVYYEVGYAVGRQKPFLLAMNYAVQKAVENVNLTGLFDTIALLRYQDSIDRPDISQGQCRCASC
jgi:hypothetical protein